LLRSIYNDNITFGEKMQEESKPESKPIQLGKKWKNESFHTTFEQADAIRQKLIRIWASNQAHNGMKVKVKYLPSRNKYVVKTRRDPSLDPKPENKETKKSGKSKQRNKENTGGRMFDPTAVI
jgi:hypothetical protein